MLDKKRNKNINKEKKPTNNNHKNSFGIILPVSAFADEKTQMVKNVVAKN